MITIMHDDLAYDNAILITVIITAVVLIMNK